MCRRACSFFEVMPQWCSEQAPGGRARREAHRETTVRRWRRAGGRWRRRGATGVQLRMPRHHWLSRGVRASAHGQGFNQLDNADAAVASRFLRCSGPGGRSVPGSLAPCCAHPLRAASLTEGLETRQRVAYDMVGAGRRQAGSPKPDGIVVVVVTSSPRCGARHAAIPQCCACPWRGE